jgi:hypothetical protein
MENAFEKKILLTDIKIYLIPQTGGTYILERYFHRQQNTANRFLAFVFFPTGN